MRRTFNEAHNHLKRSNPIVYAACVLAMIGAGVLWYTGHERWALVVFIVAGLTGLQMLRYKGG